MGCKLKIKILRPGVNGGVSLVIFLSLILIKNKTLFPKFKGSFN